MDGIQQISFSRFQFPEPVVEWCNENGAQILYPGHQDYPTSFHRLRKPPAFLAMWGKPIWKTHSCVSIVGSREPSSQSLAWMETHLSEFLRQTKVATVSGGARGIDHRVHALSLQHGLPTAVFLPSGLGQVYPREILDWKAEILESGGAILSPFYPQQLIRPRNFAGRNELIAAMGCMLFVVEARRRSGSLMTARLARDLNKTICALPSFPSAVRAAGTLDLIFDGAQPVRDADDLRALYNLCRLSTTECLVSSKRDEE